MALFPRPAPEIPERPIGALPGGSGPLAITAFGTSLTANYDWSDGLAPALEECLGRPVTVSRVARAGAGSTWGLQAVRDVVAQAPDVVLIEFSINDADMLDGISLTRSIQNHRRILAQLRAGLPRARLVLMTMSPAYGLRGLVRPWLADYYAAYGELAASEDTGLVDLYARWRKLPGVRKALTDGVHPTAAAARSVILPPLVAAFGAAAGRHCDMAGSESGSASGSAPGKPLDSLAD